MAKRKEVVTGGKPATTEAVDKAVEKERAKESKESSSPVSTETPS